MKQAVMYGAGNIGRGFIGALLSQSGYRVTFVDVALPVVEALQTRQSYPVRIVSTHGHTDTCIEHVTAVNGNDTDTVADKIASADIMATAVGVNILKFIVPNIVAGIRKRFATTDRPLNIIICENLMDANKILEGMLKAHLTPEECELFDARIGLVEASIGRMVPVQTDEMKDGDLLRVCVEKYGYLPVDRDAFVGEIPDIKSMVPFSPFDFYIKRKLYIHNMGHATTAYLGMYTGKTYIYESIDDPDTQLIAENAMLESARALSKAYNVPMASIVPHIQDLLSRFTNSALMDTCARVGGDAKRKLSPADRMIGSSTLCETMGVTPVYITIGCAGALRRYMDENELSQSRENALTILTGVSGLQADAALTQRILSFYDMLLSGASVANLRRKAMQLQAESLHDIV